MTSSAQEVLDDAFDCARAALQAAPDRGSARRILEVLRARVDATMTLSTTSPGDEREALRNLIAATDYLAATMLSGDPDKIRFAKDKVWQFVDEGKAALSSSTVQQVGAEWMPISGAPKDGSAVLVNDTAGLFTYCMARWLEGEEWEGWIYDDEIANDSNPLGPQPTHFMRIMAVPKSEQGDQQ
jgi:hypothetical protein